MITLPYTDTIQRQAAEFLEDPADAVAALYVETGGCYFGLPNVDPWDEARDARANRRYPAGRARSIQSQTPSAAS